MPFEWGEAKEDNGHSRQGEVGPQGEGHRLGSKAGLGGEEWAEAEEVGVGTIREEYLSSHWVCT